MSVDIFGCRSWCVCLCACVRALVAAKGQKSGMLLNTLQDTPRAPTRDVHGTRAEQTCFQP